MDFKRVEGIFLAVFLFLNMFLFYVYQEGKPKQDTSSSRSISENIEERLKADEISLPHSLSSKSKQGYYLSAEESELVVEAKESLKNQEWQVNNSKLFSQLPRRNDIDVSDKDEVKKVKAFIAQKQNVIKGDEYVMNAHESSSNKKYVFSQVWEDIPFYDETSQLAIYLSKNEGNRLMVDSYEQTYLNNIEPLRDQQAIVSEREAVISLYTNNSLQPGSKIKWIDLGYTRIFTIRGKNVYVPAWFIAVESSKNSVKTERVDAFSGSIISSNVSER
ncbi:MULTISPECIES: two-component system regulatory protein YycI [Vagococcus]|uniref:Regulatory protein YycH-like domain-containing protein n=1 Tax=Vagococcus fluvialis bH819 TaxID=1255619 RepID=A0A1X6WR41_9ENTE|nr:MULTISPECIES: two-component system regulatory protein YycI [Vagococcus]SLM86126.1 Distant homolog of hypothetical protein SA_21 [Vagococcus fluvialis bH819]HCM90375.1 hypothetical protein [Vagococcus sp.]